jgi:hypothetical protein
MKAKLLLFILAVAIVVPMHAQSSQMTVTIPFDFSVDSHHMPAGDYAIKSLTENTLLIRTVDGTTARVSLTSSANSGVNYRKPALIFKKIGENYFLSTAWFDGAGRQFARIKAEPAAAGQVVLTQTASN